MGIPHHIQAIILVGLALHYCCLPFVNIYNEHCLLIELECSGERVAKSLVALVGTNKSSSIALHFV